MKFLTEPSKSSYENDDSKVSSYIEEWKSKLIDLSRKNRLVYFKHSRRGNLTIVSPTAEEVFKRLVLGKRKMDFWFPSEAASNLRLANGPSQVSQQAWKPTQKQLVCAETNRKELENILKKLNRHSPPDCREHGETNVQNKFEQKRASHIETAKLQAKKKKERGLFCQLLALLIHKNACGNCHNCNSCHRDVDILERNSTIDCINRRLRRICKFCHCPK